MDTLNLFFIVIFLCQMLWYLYFVGGDSLKHPQSWNKTLARKKILPPLRRYHWLCFDHSPNLLDNQKKFKAVNFCKRAFFLVFDFDLLFQHLFSGSRISFSAHYNQIEFPLQINGFILNTENQFPRQILSGSLKSPDLPCLPWHSLSTMWRTPAETS